METAKYVSAVRSINLQEKMKPKWNECKNSYQVISQLSEQQRRRMKEMMDKRLVFPK